MMQHPELLACSLWIIHLQEKSAYDFIQTAGVGSTQLLEKNDTHGFPTNCGEKDCGSATCNILVRLVVKKCCLLRPTLKAVSPVTSHI